MTPMINSLMVRAADAPVIKPTVELGTPLLLTVAAAGVALLLLMIIRFKIQAFVALLIVSILVAVAAAAEQLYLLGQAQGLAAADDSAVIKVIAPTKRTA